MSNATVSNVNASSEALAKFAKAAALSAKTAMAAYVASLPVAPTEVVKELAVIAAKLEITEAESERVKVLKETYRFREEEKDQLSAAKAQRVAQASKPEERRKLADAITTGFIMDARRKLRVDGRVVSTIKVLV